MSVPFQVVPGNIKQQMLPFVLNPDATLNKEGTAYQQDRKSDPQYFTYKNISKYMWSGSAQLNFCPNSIKKNFDKDLANKLLYSSLNSSNESVTFSSLLNDIPGIQIREYLPDTALDQLISFMTTMIKSVMSLFGSNGISLSTKVKNEDKKKLTESQIEAKEAENQANIFERLGKVAKAIMEYVSGNGDPNIIKDVSKGDGINGSAISNIYNKNNVSSKIVEFPYMLYYQLQSCTTTNVYEIPALKPDNVMYSSNGTAGWNTDNSGFRLINKTMANLPVVGSFLSKLFGNIGISWMPYWDAMSGNATPEPNVVLEFDLFNDDIESAVHNFIFVNTLIANNKWIQHSLFQHSSCIYDVKLEGYNRLFACTGKFTVEKRGVLRLPPNSFFDGGNKVNSLKKYINKNINVEIFLETLKKDKSIMIPDIYHVKMEFESLLPANFNTYLYTLVANKDPIERYYTHTYDNSIASTAMTNAITGLIDHVKNKWKDTENKKN